MVDIQPVIVTAGIGRLIDFYCGALGANEVSRMPEQGDPFYVRLAIGDAELGLVGDDKAPAAPGPILLSIEVADVDAMVDRVRAHGGDANDPNDMPWGQRVAHAKDPDGNLVNLTTSRPT